MAYYKVSADNFPRLEGNIELFKQFMQKEFDGYLNEDGDFYAHNDNDSDWFVDQFLEAKSGVGIYRDFFANPHPITSKEK